MCRSGTWSARFRRRVAYAAPKRMRRGRPMHARGRARAGAAPPAALLGRARTKLQRTTHHHFPRQLDDPPPTPPTTTVHVRTCLVASGPVYTHDGDELAESVTARCGGCRVGGEAVRRWLWGTAMAAMAAMAGDTELASRVHAASSLWRRGPAMADDGWPTAAPNPLWRPARALSHRRAAM